MKIKFLSIAVFFLLSINFSAQVPSGDIPPPPNESGPKSEDYVYTITDEVPEFPGGVNAMRAYLKSHLHYPSRAFELNISGTSFLKFIVDKEGNIKELQVLKGIPKCKECDDEALAAVKSMPKWMPAKMEGKVVNCWFTLPVTFKIGKPEDVKSR